jgi:hypothetical protein
MIRPVFKVYLNENSFLSDVRARLVLEQHRPMGAVPMVVRAWRGDEWLHADRRRQQFSSDC